MNSRSVVTVYQAESRGFRVKAEPRFFTEQHDDATHYFIYTYRITIENRSGKNVQLLRRKWLIRDGRGNEEMVCGDGVVGKQPHISDGDSFSYISGCPLTTPTGSMRGSYMMSGSDWRRFEIRIPLFFLRPDVSG